MPRSLYDEECYPDVIQPPNGVEERSNKPFQSVWYAAGTGNLTELKPLLHLNEDTSVQAKGSVFDSSETSLLISHAFEGAAEHSQSHVIEYLCDSGAKPRWPDIRVAAKQGNIDILKLVIRRGVDLNMSYGLGRKPICDVLHDEVLLQLLLSNGADINGKLPDFNHPQSPQGKCGFFSRARHPRSPLEVAASGNSLEAVQLLLKHGADPKIGHPLCAAARSGRRDFGKTRDIIGCLIRAGCDANQHDDLMSKVYIGRPLHWAVQLEQNEEVVMLLLEHGADPNGRNAFNHTALDTAHAMMTVTPKLTELLRYRSTEKFTLPDAMEYARKGFLPISPT